MPGVEELHIQRATKVVEQLIDATLEGRAKWEPGDRRDVFVFKGESGQIHVTGPMEPGFHSIAEQYTIRMHDGRNQLIFQSTLSALDATHSLDNSYLYQRLRRLWSAVAQSGDPTIQVMDSIINELRD